MYIYNIFLPIWQAKYQYMNTIMNDSNFRDFIEEVREANPLIGIAKEYLKLSESGTIKALCPYHKEDTPSFILHPSREFFKCFGCGKVADVFDIFQLFEKVDFTTALNRLANKANVFKPKSLKEEAGQLTEQREQENKEQDLFEALLKFLKSKNSKPATYLDSRGISNETGDKYGIFECNTNIELIATEIRALGFKEEIIEFSKILFDSRFFENSLIIPVIAKGRVVTLGSRTLADRDPKYLYLKGHPKGVFNYDNALLQKQLFITEAPLDALALIEDGFLGGVSIGGCIPSEEQLTTLKKLGQGKEVFILFDNDGGEGK